MRRCGALCLLLLLYACQTLNSSVLPTMAILPSATSTIASTLPSAIASASAIEVEVATEEAVTPTLISTETLVTLPDVLPPLTSTPVPVALAVTPTPRPLQQAASETPLPALVSNRGFQTMTPPPSVIVIASRTAQPIRILSSQVLMLPTSTFTPSSVPLLIPSMTYTPTPRPGPTTTFTPVVIPSVTPTLTPMPESCYWYWATRELPELTQQIQTELGSAGLTQMTVRAYAYGEDCVSSITRKVLYFGQMETDFDLTVQVSDPLDPEALTGSLVTMINILKNHPEGTRGRIMITFTLSSGDTQKYIEYDNLMGYIAQHPDGAGVLTLMGIPTP